MDDQDLHSFGVVRNIPSKFHSSNLRNFFSDFTENGKFRCFHFKHRPEVAKPKTEDGGKPQKTGTCCCVFQTINEKSLTECIAKYNDANWVNDKGDYLKARCIVQKIRVSDDVASDKNKTAVSETEYATRGETGYKKRHAVTETFSQTDLMSLSELRPPVQVMPRGNIGTTMKEFLELVKQCKLPPKIIKKLDLKFPKTGSTRRFGNVPFDYDDTWEKITQGQNIYTANGDFIESSVNLEADEVTKQPEKPSLDAEAPDTGETSDADDDNDTCEEWERHEALHNDVTSMERTKERLFEEKIELKWEKGGSGLVFYTDAQYWHEEEGDFDEQTTDDWDVDMSEYYGGRGDLDARQFLQMRKEKRNGKSLYDDTLSRDLFRPVKNRSRSESPPSAKRRGDFEKHTRGVGRKLLEKGGWTEGDPLGPGKRSGAITDPIDLEGQHPKLRKGLGYHGNKILKPIEDREKFSCTRKPIKIPTHKRDVTTTSSFRTDRSVEPLATHSWIFPQFASNLANNEYKERTKETRKNAVPGPDDGVVITTAYDDPLLIDEQDDFLRSLHPTALKHRVKPGNEQNTSNPDSIINYKPIRSGSKLVRNQRENSAESAPKYSKNTDRPRASSSNIQLSAVKFVKGGVLNEET